MTSAITPHPRFYEEISKSMPFRAALFRPDTITIDESGALVFEPTSAVNGAPLQQGFDGQPTRDFIVPCEVQVLTPVVGEDRVRTFGGSTTITRARVAILLAGVYSHVREGDLLLVLNPDLVKNPLTDDEEPDLSMDRNPVFYNIISSGGTIAIGVTEMRAERIT